MATVFLARDLALDRQVAVKVMNPALMSSPAAIGRFRREARVAAALDHPHIISIYAVGEDAELAYYVMRYIEGRSLHDLLADEGAQTFRRVEGIVNDVGQALHYAHRRGVIHRDVKPANIMLDQDDWLVVTDFGIAKMDEGDRLTLSGHVFGTPHYMSPEYFNGGLIGSASDQYALGVVAFELLTGGTPYPGDTIGEVMRGHLFDPIPILREIRPDLPTEVDECIARMLAKDPAFRYPTVSDAVAAFRAAGRRGESSVATEIIATSTRSPVHGRVAIRPRKRTPRWATALAGTVGAVALLGTIVRVAMDLGAAQAPRGAPASPTASDSGALKATGATELASSSTPNIAPTNTPTSVPSGPAATPNTRSVPPRSVPPASRVSEKSVATDGASREPAPVGNAAPPVTAPVAAQQFGEIRIGSRVPLAVLYIGTQAPRLIGEQGIQTLSVPAGQARLSIRLDGCARWDTTVSVTAGETKTIGFRAPRCE